MSSIWNEWMIGCGIGVRGAQRTGEMLEKNASLMTINLRGEFLLNIPPPSVVIEYYLVEDGHPKRVRVHWVWDIDVVVIDVCVGNAENDIGDEGAIRIAEGLEKNTAVKILRLRGVFPAHLFFIHWCISYSFIAW
jgi:hypothetical protein